jgi:hypothetical protein
MRAPFLGCMIDVVDAPFVDLLTHLRGSLAGPGLLDSKRGSSCEKDVLTYSKEIVLVFEC